MKEIEVKFLSINPAQVEKKLKLLGAKKAFGPTLFTSTHFKHPKLGKKYFTLLRLRLEGKTLVLATKRRRAGGRFKTEYELEVHIADKFETAFEFMKALGFRVKRQHEKFRTEYKLGKIKIEIDRYPKINPYVEIEGPDRKSIRILAEKLGFDFKDASSDTATAVIKKAGLNDRRLLFKRS